MNVRPLPKKWLIHDMVYIAKDGKDGWGNPIEHDPIVIKHVRYDDSTVFSRDSTQTKVLADGIIFVDAVNSKPIVEFKEESAVSILMNDSVISKELTIKKIIPCYYPTRKAIRHYELEVI